MDYWLQSLGFMLIISCAKSLVIVPVGDSITEGFDGRILTDGYRGQLCNDLVSNFPKQSIKFAGVRGNGACTSHEAVSGDEIKDINERLGRIVDANPDLILLMIGSNDIGKGSTVSEREQPAKVVDVASSFSSLSSLIPMDAKLGEQPRVCFESPEVAASFVEARLEGLVNELYAQLPQVHIFLATIPRLPPSSHAWRNYAKCESVGNSIRISGEKYNNLLREKYSTRANMTLVDIEKETGLCPADDNTLCSDWLHPSAAGYKQMADVWRKALNGYLDSLPLPAHQQ